MRPSQGSLPAHSGCAVTGQSRKNPQLCARCVESAPEGGAVVPLSVLFADVRGYTSLTERLGTIGATALVNRFYEVASKAFLPFEGLLGQIAGDEVMVLFVPGLAGRSYRTKAVLAGASLLDAAGYGKSAPSWVDVGVGISSGEEFVGNVGGGGFKDFTAIGDVTNTVAQMPTERHVVHNEGTVPFVVDTLYVLPPGTPNTAIRVDQPQPAACPSIH